MRPPQPRRPPRRRARFFLHCAHQLWRQTVLAVTGALLLAGATAHADDCPTALAPLFEAFQAFGGGGVAPFTLVTNHHDAALETYTTTTATGLLRFDAVAPDTPFLYSDHAPQVLSTRVASHTGQPLEAGVPAALGLLTIYADGQVVHHTEARTTEVAGTCVGTVLSGYDGVDTMVILSIGQPRADEALPAANGGDSSITEVNGNVGIGTTNPALLSGWSGRMLSISDTLNPGLALTNTGSGGNQFFLYSHTNGSAGSGSFRIYDATNRADRFVLNNSGNVGIGTDNPTSSKLTLEGQDALSVRGYEPFITFFDSNHGYARGAIQQVAGGLNLFTDSYLSGANPFGYLRLDNSGNVGIGSATPQAKLEVASGSGDILRLIGYEPFISLFDGHHGYAPAYIQNAGGHLVFKPTGFDACCAAMVIQPNTGNVGIGTGNPQARLDVVGRTRTGSLEITGGADFAEHFDVNVAKTSGEAITTKVEAGMVVSIDPAHPGKLALSTQAYDRRVAGIISGAGGVKPGMMMSQEGTLADGQYPVALSGRVYCWVDASQGAVEPGDLLTTSDTPGHAMKVADREKAQGAIIGKAMTGLKEDKGLVLVLVTLQ
jgi:hypothetical protein